MTIGDPQDAPGALTAARIASAPCSFGVDEVVADDAWTPGPDEMLDWMLGIGYHGTELGAPGYLGTVVAPGGVVVYGTGYVYTPYVGTSVWYPPPVTYGYAANPYWTPWTG